MGNQDYLCSPHPFMIAQVVVTGTDVAGAKAIVVETTAPAAATMPASMHPEGGMKR